MLLRVVALEDSRFDAGATAATPAVNSTVAQLLDLGQGIYQLDIVTFQTGTVDANRTNMELLVAGTVRGDLLSTAVGSRVVLPRVIIGPTGTDDVIVRTGSTVGGAASVYCAQLTATRVG